MLEVNIVILFITHFLQQIFGGGNQVLHDFVWNCVTLIAFDHFILNPGC